MLNISVNTNPVRLKANLENPLSSSQSINNTFQLPNISNKTPFKVNHNLNQNVFFNQSMFLQSKYSIANQNQDITINVIKSEETVGEVEVDDFKIRESLIQELETKDKLKLTEKKHLEKLKREQQKMIDERNNPPIIIQKDAYNRSQYAQMMAEQNEYLDQSMSQLTLPILRNQRMPKHKYGFEQEDILIIKEDCRRIQEDAKRMNLLQFREKLDDMLDRSRIQSNLDEETDKFNERKKELNNQMGITPEKIKQRQMQQKQAKGLSSLAELFGSQEKMNTKSMLEAGGGELFINQLIQYIKEKKGFVNKREFNKQKLINLSLKQSNSIDDEFRRSQMMNHSQLRNRSQESDDSQNRQIEQHNTKQSNTNLIKKPKVKSQRSRNQINLTQIHEQSQSLSHHKRSYLADLQFRDNSIQNRYQRDIIDNQVKRLQEEMKLRRSSVQMKVGDIIQQLSKVTLDQNTLDPSIEILNQESSTNIFISDMEQTNASSNYIHNLFKSNERKEFNKDTFNNLLTQLSLQYGYDPNYKTKQEKISLSHRRIKSKKNATMGESQIDFSKEQKGNVADLMKDEKMIERYSKHLNKCFFITSDPFIKKKHTQYLQKVSPRNEETFFKRMSKDNQQRLMRQSEEEKQSQSFIQRYKTNRKQSPSKNNRSSQRNDSADNLDSFRNEQIATDFDNSLDMTPDIEIFDQARGLL